MSYRIALRPDDVNPDLLDGVVVNDVAMFRAEQMGAEEWWLCCYLTGEALGPRIVFSLGWDEATHNLEMRVTGRPEGVRPYGDFTPGRLLTDVRRIDPVPAKGKQGLWEWAT